MDKKGFVFIETIIVIVVLTSTLLLLYSSFTKILQSEKTRIYYDDVNYLYRTQYIASILGKLNLTSVFNAVTDASSRKERYVLKIGTNTSGTYYNQLFSGRTKEKTLFNKLISTYNVSDIIVFEDVNTNNIKQCNLQYASNPVNTYHKECSNLLGDVSSDMMSYLKTLFVDTSSTYVIVIEYKSCDSKTNTNCRNYYSWVGV